MSHYLRLQYGMPIQYFAKLSTGKIILWCYLIWYLVTLAYYLDTNPMLWLNSLGISVVIGIGLMLSVNGNPMARPDGWQTFRLFLMPFCVSSFSSLIKGQGFILILPPRLSEQLVLIGLCTAFVLWVLLLKYLSAPKEGRGD